MKKYTQKPTYAIMKPKFTFHYEIDNAIDSEEILKPEELDFPEPEFYEFDDLRDK